MLLFNYFSIWKKITVMGGEKISDLLIFSNLLFEEMLCIIFSVRDCFRLRSQRTHEKNHGIWGQETHERYLQNNKSAHSKKWVRFLHISSHFWIFLKFENYVYQFHILIFHNLPIPASHMRCQRPGLLPMSVPAKLEVGKDRFASCQLKTPWWNLKVPVNGQVVRRGRT